ncbi:MAG: dTDP-4-dehydrorhamnose reductase [Caldilineae bacterium]|nr:MAG: dTDP-4-dehydrorhamnose reductase [Caldilineae bacterium]
MARILIIGHKGQLGQTLMNLPLEHERLGIDLPEHDITLADDIIPTILELKPDVVINPAAFTNVDAAESDPDLTYRVNAHGAGNVARACHRLGIPLIHISTNEVFDGTSDKPYDEWDQPHPISTYARSKLAGENAVRFYHDDVRIVRIAWLFAPGGNNFPAKIVAAADKHGALRVVDDEFGNPTYAPDLAPALFALLERQAPPGIYHLTNSGTCSRYEFALEVLRQSGRGHIPVTPIPHSEWSRPSRPPLRAILANRAAAALGIRLRPWQEAVADWARQSS